MGFNRNRHRRRRSRSSSRDRDRRRRRSRSSSRGRDDRKRSPSPHAAPRPNLKLIQQLLAQQQVRREFFVHLSSYSNLTICTPTSNFIQANANPQLTRQARRLYVGNLPIGLGMTEPVLTQFFNNAAISVGMFVLSIPMYAFSKRCSHFTPGITTPVPVCSVWCSTEGTFCVCDFAGSYSSQHIISATVFATIQCGPTDFTSIVVIQFVEFRAVSDASRCLTLFEGLQIGGRPLRIGRPADYAPAPPHLANYVLEQPGLPLAPEGCTGKQAALGTAAESIGVESAVASGTIYAMTIHRYTAIGDAGGWDSLD